MKRRAFEKRSEELARRLQEEEYMDLDDPPPKRSILPVAGPSRALEEPERVLRSKPLRSQEQRASQELSDGQHNRKYASCIQEEERAKNALLEDLVGSVKAISKDVAQGMQVALETVKQASAVAADVERRVEDLSRIRERLAAIIGKTATRRTTPSGDSTSQLARLKDELKASNREAKNLARKISENERLRKSHLPTQPLGLAGDDAAPQHQEK